MDLRNTVKNGILYLEDPVDKEWNPHFFVLTQNKLFYTDSFQNEQEAGGEEEEEESSFHRAKEVSLQVTFYFNNAVYGQLLMK